MRVWTQPLSHTRQAHLYLDNDLSLDTEKQPCFYLLVELREAPRNSWDIADSVPPTGAADSPVQLGQEELWCLFLWEWIHTDVWLSSDSEPEAATVKWMILKGKRTEQERAVILTKSVLEGLETGRVELAY